MDLIVRWSDRQKEFLSVSIVDTAILASLLNWAKFQPKWRRLLSAVNVICNQYTKNYNALIAICTIKELFCASKIGICIIFLSIDALDRVANNINFHLLLRINVNRFHSEWYYTHKRSVAPKIWIWKHLALLIDQCMYWNLCRMETR